WKNSPRFFRVRALVVVAIYVLAGWLVGRGYEGWIVAIPVASFAAFILFVQSVAGSGSGSRSGGDSGSSASSSSSSRSSSDSSSSG
ncbi:hypothetical protein KZZ05_21435, partial [Marinobacter adhaerens]|nr:hypothetical protein [Marinobacter adhaerens]